MITKVEESGSIKSRVNGITTNISWHTPDRLPHPDSSYLATDSSSRLTHKPNLNSRYNLSSQGSITFTIAWVYPNGLPGPYPSNHVTLAVTPYTRGTSSDKCSCSVDDGYSDPSIHYGSSGGLYSGYTYLNHHLMPHTELIPLTASNGTVIYATPIMKASLAAIASGNDRNAQSAKVYNQINASIDNRAIIVRRTTPAINQWFSPSDGYTLHGDTTYGYTTSTSSAFTPPTPMYQSNWQSFKPTFLGNWKSAPTVRYHWSPEESSDNRNFALWDIANGGQSEENDEMDIDGKWSRSPAPISRTIQYSATDSDNATFTADYIMNIHPMVEPLSNHMHQVWSDPVTFGDPVKGKTIIVYGPRCTAPNYTYRTTVEKMQPGSMNSAASANVIAQFLSLLFSGTGAEFHTYTYSITVTIGPGGWPRGGLKSNEKAYIAEDAMWDRYVLDYRSFSPAGESLLWNSSNQAVAHRTVCDEGPISDPSLFWKVVPKDTPILLPGVMSAPPISEDNQMPAPYLYDPHTP